MRRNDAVAELVAFDFDSGISGSGNEFFIVSVRFDDGSDVRTLSYIVSVTDSGSCPRP